MVKCKECKHCLIRGKEVFCKHPDQSYIFNYFREKKMSKYPGFQAGINIIQNSL